MGSITIVGWKLVPIGWNFGLKFWEDSISSFLFAFLEIFEIIRFLRVCLSMFSILLYN